jgi:hypothetical protein
MLFNTKQIVFIRQIVFNEQMDKGMQASNALIM